MIDITIEIVLVAIGALFLGCFSGCCFHKCCC